MGQAIEFHILGPLRVVRAGQTVAVSAPKERALLATLLLRPGDMVASDWLIDELWGSDTLDDPLASLRVVVSRVRRHLEVGGADVELRALGQGYALRLPPEDLDAARFRAAVQAAERLLAAGAVADAARAYRQALELWRGDTLADVALGAESLALASALDDERLEATEAWSDAELALGRHAEVVGQLQELVGRHPLREGLALRLATALARCGRHAEALRCLAELRRAVAEEGLAVSTAVASLEQDVAVHDPGIEWHPPEHLPLPDAEPAQESGTDDCGPGPAVGVPPQLVGRADAGAALQEVRIEVAAGAARLLVLAGEPGTGKTALLGELCRAASHDGWTVLAGHCLPERLRPYGCLVEALRPLMGSLPPERRHELAIFDPDPSLRTAPGVTGVGDRQVSFQSLAEALSAAARSGPILLVIDDVQWVDPLTSAALDYLAPALAHLPVLLATGLRDTDAAAEAVARSLREGWGATVPLRRLNLGPLSEAEVVELVSALNGRPLTAAERRGAKEIWRHSAGNPYVAAEWARGLVADGSQGAFEGHDGSTTLPDAAKTLLEDRLVGLSPDDRRALEAAAVVGPEFTLDLLGAAVGGRPREAVEAAVRRRLVEPAPADEGRFRFTHALVRESLLDATPAARRMVIHDTVAGFLARRVAAGHPTEEDVQQLAVHGLGSAPLRPQRAVDAAAAAADAALRRLAFEDAASLLGRCLELVDAGVSVSATVRADLSFGLTDALFRSSAPGFEQAWVAAVDAARACGDPERLARVALILPVWHDHGAVGVSDERRRTVAREAVTALGHTNPALRVRVLAALARQMEPGPERRDVVAELSSLAATTPDAQAQVDALVTMVDLDAPVPDPSHLLTTARRLLALPEDEVGGPEAAVMCAFQHVHLCAMADRGALDAAMAEAARRADRSGQAYFRCIVTWWKVDQLILAGPLDAAQKACDEAVNLSFASGIPPDFAMRMSGVVLGQLAFHQGTLGGLYPTTLALAQSSPGSEAPWAFVALAAYGAGEHEAAAAILDRVTATDFETVVGRELWLPSMGLFGLVAARLGRRQAAERILTFLEPYRGQWGWNWVATPGPVDYLIGVLHRACGREREAIAALSATVAEARQCGAQVWVGWALAELALARSASGDVRGAMRDHDEAVAVAAQGGFEGVAAFVRQARNRGEIAS